MHCEHENATRAERDTAGVETEAPHVILQVSTYKAHAWTKTL